LKILLTANFELAEFGGIIVRIEFSCKPKLSGSELPTISSGKRCAIFKKKLNAKTPFYRNTRLS
jgi:hypothetical protein